MNFIEQKEKLGFSALASDLASSKTCRTFSSVRSSGGRAAEMSGRDDLREVLEDFDLRMPFLVARVRVLRMLDLQRFEGRRRGRWDEKEREDAERPWIFNAIFWVFLV